MIDFAIDRAHLWHPYAPMTEPPPVEGAAETAGSTILLADGTRLIDGISSWWCASFGHRPASVVRAIREQAAKMPHVMFAGFTHEPATALADRLLGILPAGIERFFYADSGSIAVECALKMALQYQRGCGRPARTRIAALRGGYHGDTVGAMSVSDPGGMHSVFAGILPQGFFAPQPPVPFHGTWSDDAFAPMAELLDRHADEIAAVIVEPVFQGANAMRFYHPEYLKRLRDACDRLGIVLIFDEIATGFWRTGRRFALEYAGVTPDILCLGKALTAGCISFACAAATAEIADRAGALLHGPTFMANPLGCAAACAALDLAAAFRGTDELRRIEKRLRSGLLPCRKIPNVREVRVLGAIGVLEVDRLPSPETIHRIVRETGVWLRPYGRWIYTMPPFVAADGELDRITAAMRRCARAGRLPREASGKPTTSSGRQAASPAPSGRPAGSCRRS